jgi:hypothetical protein
MLAVLDRIETFPKPPLQYNGPDSPIREEKEDHMMDEQSGMTRSGGIAASARC